MMFIFQDSKDEGSFFRPAVSLALLIVSWQ